MSKVSDMLTKGQRTLADAFGTIGGNLISGATGSSTAFTGARQVAERRTPRPGRYGEVRLERDLAIPTSGLATAPVAGDRLTFTGSAKPWSVVLVDPTDGGDTRIGWRVTVRDWINETE